MQSAEGLRIEMLKAAHLKGEEKYQALRNIKSQINKIEKEASMNFDYPLREINITRELLLDVNAGLRSFLPARKKLKSTQRN